MFFGQAALFFLLMEVFTLFLVIGKIGFLKTFLLWLFSAAAGALIIQRQGIAILMRSQEVFNRGAVPVDDLFDGLCLAIAGLLFMIPGFISDTIAFLLLIPMVRKKIQEKYPAGFTMRTPVQRSDDGVIDGSYVRVEEAVEVIEQKPDTDPKTPA